MPLAQTLGVREGGDRRRQLLPQAVDDARDQEITWTQTGELLGTTAAAAARHYRKQP